MGGSYADLTREENGLPCEPLLRILLRSRGGMRGEIRVSTQNASGSRGRGRGHGPPGRSDKKQGGGLTTEFGMDPTSLRGREGRGQDRDCPPNATRRSTLVHTADQEPFGANKLNALLKATQESYSSMLALHYLQSWEASQITIDYGPIPPTEEKQEENVTKSSEQEETQVTNRQIPQPNTEADTLPKDTTIQLEVPAKVRVTAGRD